MASVARDAWTDERLDDLKGSGERLGERMEAGFAATREEFRAVRSEMSQQFAIQNGLMLIGFLGVSATILTQA